jgi:hypothetical protein
MMTASTNQHSLYHHQNPTSMQALLNVNKKKNHTDDLLLMYEEIMMEDDYGMDSKCIIGGGDDNNENSAVIATNIQKYLLETSSITSPTSILPSYPTVTITSSTIEKAKVPLPKIETSIFDTIDSSNKFAWCSCPIYNDSDVDNNDGENGHDNENVDDDHESHCVASAISENDGDYKDDFDDASSFWGTSSFASICKDDYAEDRMTTEQAIQLVLRTQQNWTKSSTTKKTMSPLASPVPKKKSILKKISAIPSASEKSSREIRISRASTASTSALFQKVSFSTVSIRKYVMELGVNPSCSFGPPVQLSWEIIDHDYDEDDYNEEKGNQCNSSGKMVDWDDHSGIQSVTTNDMSSERFSRSPGARSVTTTTSRGDGSKTGSTQSGHSFDVETRSHIIDVDLYEHERAPRRRKKPQYFCFNYYQRRNILFNAGYDITQIKVAEKEVEKVKRQRYTSRAMIPLAELESTFKNVLSGGRRQQNKTTKP